MSDSSAPYGPVGGMAAYMLIRALMGQKPKRGAPSPAATPARQRPVAAATVRVPSRAPVPPASRPVPAPPAPPVVGPAKAAPPPPTLGMSAVPVVPWTGRRELLAWRAWGMAYWSGEPWPHLTSLGVKWVWSGPVLRADCPPHGTADNRSGVHAMKARLYGRADWVWSEFCWVTGWVALSGRVVEHELGYRAERAVIRKLRLGLGLHLVEPRLPALIRIARELEEHYQAPVKIGWAERRLAQALLQRGFQPKFRSIMWCLAADGWRMG